MAGALVPRNTGCMLAAMTARAGIIAGLSGPVLRAANPLQKLENHPVIWLLRQPLFWAALGIVLGPYLFWRGFQLLQRKRTIMNIPRSTVRGAALGAVEVSGKAAGPYTIVSPVANADCYYYRVVLRVLRPGERRTLALVDDMCAPLFLDDGTGQVLLDPRGAELMLPGPQADGIGSEYLRHVLARHGYSEADLVSTREVCIQPGENLFVLGTLRENTWAKSQPGSTLQRIGPGFVSEAEALLQQSSALPSAALGPDARPPRPAGAAAFNLSPPVILMKGGTPFVISNQSEREVLAQLNWTSVLYIWSGPLMTIAGAWEILQRLHAWGVLPAR
jgi:hypothetical protein